ADFFPQLERSDAPFDVLRVRFISYERLGCCSCATAHAEGRPMSKRALSVTREQNFPEWYQAIVRDGDMAETSPVRGCMIIKPWGWGVWERIQAELDTRIKETGHDNCYFPLFIPMSFIAKEAQHVEGFAKEMAVVTHHRLKNDNGQLVVDPAAKLEEPLIVRPTSET